MSRKRAAEEGRPHPSSTPAALPKRSRHSSPQPSDSSAVSSTHVSEDSALRSSPTVTRGSSVSSLASPGVDGGEDAVSSSSSEESSVLDSEEEDDDEDEAEDGEDEVITIGGPRKPWIARHGVLGGAHDLQARISALLPQLAAANQDLESLGPGAASMEEVREGEQHIEMDLGLGVLEEKQQDDSSSGSEDEDEDDDTVAGDGSSKSHQGVQRDSAVLDKLMGVKGSNSSKPGIQELG